MIFYTYYSSIPRDGLAVHLKQETGVRAICGASGVSFNDQNQYKWEVGQFYRYSENLYKYDDQPNSNPITCPRCLKRMAGLIRPDDENRGYIWHYKGCEIVSNEGHPNLPKYYCSIREYSYPCWTLKQGMQVIDKEMK